MIQLHCNDPRWNIFKLQDKTNTRIHYGTLFGYKGFNDDMTCLNHKYEVGKTYNISKEHLRICSNGFHFCRYPNDIHKYYNNNHIKYALVRANNIIIEDNDKCVTNQITIIKMMSKEELFLEMPTYIIRINGTYEPYLYGMLHGHGDMPAIMDGNHMEWYKNGKLHRDGDLPAYIDGDMINYYKNGKLHRDGDLPAYINGDMRQWFKNGQPHRDCDLPALIYKNIREWYKNGQPHRDGDLPAVIDGNRQEWYKNGQPHRDGDLPAVIDGNRQEWYKNGRLQKICINE
jgi:antitoxin component YwqK of YwqJK toxin-antitoxin module